MNVTAFTSSGEGAASNTVTTYVYDTPNNLTADTVNTTKVYLRWQLPTGASLANVNSFKIYKNSVLLTTLTNTSWCSWNNNTTSTTKVSTTSPFQGGSCMYLNTGYMTCVMSSTYTTIFANAWTIELFYKFTAVAEQPVLSSSLAGNYLYLAVMSGKIRLQLGNNGWIVNAAGVTGSTTLSVNTWYHIAIQFTGTSYDVYVDGKREQSFASTVNYALTSLSSMFLGTNGASTSTQMNGYIDAMRISGTSRYSGTTYTPPSLPYSRDRIPGH